jgi:4-hydroxy-3-methylbut-2-enyl diphosphate reductase IspH
VKYSCLVGRLLESYRRYLLLVANEELPDAVRAKVAPNGGTVLYSAHGVSPAVRDASVTRNLRAIDATCQLVTKVHMEAIKLAWEGM